MGEADDEAEPPTLEQWARSWKIPTGATLAPVEDYDEPSPFTAAEVATRAIVLHGVVAAAYGVDVDLIAEWFAGQGIWDAVSPRERRFLADPSGVTSEELNRLRWRQETEWALLWVVGKVESLGLPDRLCDTRRLVDEIVPPLGSDLQPFLASSRLRLPGELLPEVDRYYNLWCRYVKARRIDPGRLPRDLNAGVLYWREYAFEWLLGVESWDDVQCDA